MKARVIIEYDIPDGAEQPFVQERQRWVTGEPMVATPGGARKSYKAGYRVRQSC